MKLHLPTLVVRISLDDDRERLTPFLAEDDSANPWLTASFTPLSFDKIALSVSCLGGNRARWLSFVLHRNYQYKYQYLELAYHSLPVDNWYLRRLK